MLMATLSHCLSCQPYLQMFNQSQNISKGKGEVLHRWGQAGNGTGDLSFRDHSTVTLINPADASPAPPKSQANCPPPSCSPLAARAARLRSAKPSGPLRTAQVNWKESTCQPPLTNETRQGHAETTVADLLLDSNFPSSAS